MSRFKTGGIPDYLGTRKLTVAKSNDSKLNQAAKRRQHILETAERLFAEHGVLEVSLNEINKAAGQKNTSALHYHFGSRDGLLTAILDQHVDGLRLQVGRRLDKLEQQSGSKILARDFVEAYIGPYLRKLNDVRGLRFLQINSMVLAVDASRAIEQRDTASTDDLRPRIQNMLNWLLADLSEHELNMRTLSFGLLMFSALSSYGRLDHKSARQIFGSKTRFAEHLKTTLAAVLSAPPSGEGIA
jgi:AcrR family transcriptional regulator